MDIDKNLATGVTFHASLTNGQLSLTLGVGVITLLDALKAKQSNNAFVIGLIEVVEVVVAKI